MRGEDMLRETLAARAEDAPRAVGLAEGARARARRHGHVVAGATAFAVAVLAVGAAALVRPSDREGAPVATATLEPPLGAGLQRVSFRGVEVDVPAQWKRNATRCGSPTQDTYVAGGGVTLTCMPDRRADLTVAYLQHLAGWEILKTEVRGERVEPVTIGGYAAERMTGTHEDGRAVVGVAVPSRKTAVWVLSEDEATARTIVGTVRVVDVDLNGCHARLDPVYGLPSPARAEAFGTLVPPGVDGASVCRYYGDGWLAQSARIGEARAVELADALNALRRGFDPTPSPAERDCSRVRERDEAPYFARFRYDAGAPVDVLVHLDGCRDLGATNGAVRVGDVRTLYDLFTGFAGADTMS